MKVPIAVMMPAPPDPGIPKAIMQENRNWGEKDVQSHKIWLLTWQKKIKKKSIKLKLESLRKAL